MGLPSGSARSGMHGSHIVNLEMELSTLRSSHSTDLHMHTWLLKLELRMIYLRTHLV